MHGTVFTVTVFITDSDPSQQTTHKQNSKSWIVLLGMILFNRDGDQAIKIDLSIRIVTWIPYQILYQTPDQSQARSKTRIQVDLSTDFFYF